MHSWHETMHNKYDKGPDNGQTYHYSVTLYTVKVC